MFRRSNIKILLPITVVVGILVIVLFLVLPGLFNPSSDLVLDEQGVLELQANVISENELIPLASPNDPLLETLPLESADILLTNDTNQYTQDELNNIRVYESRNSAVVNVSTETIAYNWFFDPVPQEGGTGSGSIIDTRGYVLTNYHVIKDSITIYVTLASQNRYEAELVGVDPENDLAVLKIEPENEELFTIPLGDSNDLRIGQKVLAIGNPFSFDRTLTTGVVSGLGRPIRNDIGTVIQNMIQTDASINPGNSGGPLLDSSGRMIGVNTMIYSPSGGSVGVGFAVPINTAKRVIPDLIDNGRVNRGWIEIIPIQIFPELASYANLPVSQGLLVSQLIENGNAEQAGIRGGQRGRAVRYGRTIIYLGGDVIVEIDGLAVSNLANMYEALEDNKPGDSVSVKYYRAGTLEETTIVLSNRPEQYSLE
jgi:S1-C subfamily serine protease